MSGLKCCWEIPESSVHDIEVAWRKRKATSFITIELTLIGFEPADIRIWFVKKVAEPISWETLIENL